MHYSVKDKSLAILLNLAAMCKFIQLFKFPFYSYINPERRTTFAEYDLRTKKNIFKCL